MRIMNKIKVTVSKGKQTDKQVIEEGKKVADSVADYLTHKAEIELSDAKDSGRLKIVTVWEDAGDANAKPKKKSTKKSD